MINKRQLLFGAAAASAVAALPSFPAIAIPVSSDERVMQWLAKIDRHFDGIIEALGQPKENTRLLAAWDDVYPHTCQLSKKVNRKIVEMSTKPPEYYDNLRYRVKFDPDYLMDMPIALINDRCVAARTRNLRTQFSMELYNDLRLISALDVEEELIKILAIEAHYELGREQARLGRAGLTMCPYMPVLAYHAIDPHTFVPMMCFRTRYGVIET